MVNLRKLLGEDKKMDVRMDVGIDRYFGRVVRYEGGYGFETEVNIGVNGSRKKITVTVPLYHNGKNRVTERDGGLVIINPYEELKALTGEEQLKLTEEEQKQNGKNRKERKESA